MSYQFTGVFIPVQILLNKNIPQLAKILWAEICALSQNRPCKASNAHFASHYGTSEKTIQRMVQCLLKEGLIEVFEGKSRLREIYAVQPQSAALSQKKKEARRQNQNTDKDVQVDPDKNVHRIKKVSPSCKRGGSIEEKDPFSLLENDPFFQSKEVIPASVKDQRKAEMDGITEAQTERLLYTTFDDPKVLDKLRSKFHWKTLYYMARDVKSRMQSEEIKNPLNYFLKCISQKLLNYKSFMCKIKNANKHQEYSYA